jgi:polyisoprenoid-binding protein YceI
MMKIAVLGAVIAAVSLSAAAAADSVPVPVYGADLKQSKLQFTGVQAGAEFKGEFHQWSATVNFAPDSLAGSQLDVLIELASVDSMDKDRDTTMRGPDIFDVARTPTAHYVTRSITKTATGFAAVGALTLHGVTKDVPIAFQFAAAPGGATLTGTASLKRLDFGVGQGDWKSTEWIADAVKINFSLVLKPKT